MDENFFICERVSERPLDSDELENCVYNGPFSDQELASLFCFNATSVDPQDYAEAIEALRVYRPDAYRMYCESWPSECAELLGGLEEVEEDDF